MFVYKCLFSFSENENCGGRRMKLHIDLYSHTLQSVLLTVGGKCQNFPEEISPIPSSGKELFFISSFAADVGTRLVIAFLLWITEALKSSFEPNLMCLTRILIFLLCTSLHLNKNLSLSIYKIKRVELGNSLLYLC